MAPRKLTAYEQAFVNKWVPEMVYFVKMMRRANRYIVTIPDEVYMAAYEDVNNSRFVVGGGADKRSGVPKRKDSEDYVRYMKSIIDHNPIGSSAKNAVMVFFAGNAGTSAISKTLVIEQSQRTQKRFWEEVHKLNNADLEQVLNEEARRGAHNENPVPVIQNDTIDRNISRDPDEHRRDRPFIRPQSVPGNVKVKVSQTNWQQYEKVCRILFLEDHDDDTGYTAIELAGILYLETGKFYMIRYEGNVDSIRLSENEMFGMIEDGLWA